MPINVRKFELECLEAHNRFRAQHGSPPLVLNKILTEKAREWAETLAQRKTMERSSDNNYGENIYMAEGIHVDGSRPVKAWYDEIDDYNFAEPKFVKNAGHFTQLVWKATQDLGIGVAKNDDVTIVVTNYFPAGNVHNHFEENVKPPLHTYSDVYSDEVLSFQVNDESHNPNFSPSANFMSSTRNSEIQDRRYLPGFHEMSNGSTNNNEMAVTTSQIVLQISKDRLGKNIGGRPSNRVIQHNVKKAEAEALMPPPQKPPKPAKNRNQEWNKHEEDAPRFYTEARIPPNKLMRNDDRGKQSEALMPPPQILPKPSRNQKQPWNRNEDDDRNFYANDRQPPDRFMRKNEREMDPEELMPPPKNIPRPPRNKNPPWKTNEDEAKNFYADDRQPPNRFMRNNEREMEPEQLMPPPQNIPRPPRNQNPPWQRNEDDSRHFYADGRQQPNRFMRNNEREMEPEQLMPPPQNIPRPPRNQRQPWQRNEDDAKNFYSDDRQPPNRFMRNNERQMEPEELMPPPQNIPRPPRNQRQPWQRNEDDANNFYADDRQPPNRFMRNNEREMDQKDLMPPPQNLPRPARYRSQSNKRNEDDQNPPGALYRSVSNIVLSNNERKIPHYHRRDRMGPDISSRFEKSSREQPSMDDSVASQVIEIDSQHRSLPHNRSILYRTTSNIVLENQGKDARPPQQQTNTTANKKKELDRLTMLIGNKPQSQDVARDQANIASAQPNYSSGARRGQQNERPQIITNNRQQTSNPPTSQPEGGGGLFSTLYRSVSNIMVGNRANNNRLAIEPAPQAIAPSTGQASRQPYVPSNIEIYSLSDSTLDGHSDEHTNWPSNAGKIGQIKEQPTEPQVIYLNDQYTRQPTGQSNLQRPEKSTGRSTGQTTTQPTARPFQQPNPQWNTYSTEHPDEQSAGQSAVRSARQPIGQSTGHATTQPTTRPLQQSNPQWNTYSTEQPADKSAGQSTGQSTGRSTRQSVGQSTRLSTVRSFVEITPQSNTFTTGQPTETTGPSKAQSTGPSTGQIATQPPDRQMIYLNPSSTVQNSGESTVEPTEKLTRKFTTRSTKDPTTQSNVQTSTQDTAPSTRQPINTSNAPPSLLKNSEPPTKSIATATSKKNSSARSPMRTPELSNQKDDKFASNSKPDNVSSTPNNVLTTQQIRYPTSTKQTVPPTNRSPTIPTTATSPVHEQNSINHEDHDVDLQNERRLSTVSGNSTTKTSNDPGRESIVVKLRHYDKDDDFYRQMIIETPKSRVTRRRSSQDSQLPLIFKLAQDDQQSTRESQSAAVKNPENNDLQPKQLSTPETSQSFAKEQQQQQQPIKELPATPRSNFTQLQSIAEETKEPSEELSENFPNEAPKDVITNELSPKPKAYPKTLEEPEEKNLKALSSDVAQVNALSLKIANQERERDLAEALASRDDRDTSSSSEKEDIVSNSVPRDSAEIRNAKMTALQDPQGLMPPMNKSPAQRKTKDVYAQESDEPTSRDVSNHRLSAEPTAEVGHGRQRSPEKSSPQSRSASTSKNIQPNASPTPTRREVSKSPVTKKHNPDYIMGDKARPKSPQRTDQTTSSVKDSSMNIARDTSPSPKGYFPNQIVLYQPKQQTPRRGELQSKSIPSSPIRVPNPASPAIKEITTPQSSTEEYGSDEAILEYVRQQSPEHSDWQLRPINKFIARSPSFEAPDAVMREKTRRNSPERLPMAIHRHPIFPSPVNREVPSYRSAADQKRQQTPQRSELPPQLVPMNSFSDPNPVSPIRRDISRKPKERKPDRTRQFSPETPSKTEPTDSTKGRRDLTPSVFQEKSVPAKLKGHSSIEDFKYSVYGREVKPLHSRDVSRTDPSDIEEFDKSFDLYVRNTKGQTPQSNRRWSGTGLTALGRQGIIPTKSAPGIELDFYEQHSLYSPTGVKRLRPSIDFSIVEKNFQIECLNAHNCLRARHGSPPLKLCEQLSTYATKWAQELARLNKLFYSPTEEIGENIYMSSGLRINGATPVKAWYNEVRDYDFLNGQFTPFTGHFTQIVWKNTQEMGVGVAKNKKSFIVVASYYPPGNRSGQFNDNVLPRRAVKCNVEPHKEDDIDSTDSGSSGLMGAGVLFTLLAIAVTSWIILNRPYMK